MTLLNVQVQRIGSAPRDSQLPASDDECLKQVIDRHYEDLFPDYRRPIVLPLDSWQEFDSDYLAYFEAHYDFAIYHKVGGTPTRVHLIDRVRDLQSSQVAIVRPHAIRTDDSIPFFLIDRHENMLEEVMQEAQPDARKQAALGLLETILSELDSYVVVDNYTRAHVEHKLETFMTQFIPSALALEMGKDYMNYYNRFLVSLVHQICVLSYCLKSAGPGTGNTVLRAINRAWVDSFLYRIQNLMLVALNIPEIFMRNVYPSKSPYNEDLEAAGIKKPAPDNVYYRDNILAKCVSEVYRPIFNALSITSYRDYMAFCRDASLGDQPLGEVVHALRILFNKLKHSSQVQIIKSRDERALRRQQLEELQQERASIGDIQFQVRKEIIEKVRSAQAHLDFDDPLFKHRNGILVYGDQPNEWFKITLYDLEFAAKVLIGILAILDRTRRASPGVQNQP